MSTNGNSNWLLRTVLGLALGFIFGSGISALVGKGYTDAAEARMTAKVEELQEDVNALELGNAADVENQIAIATALAELKTEVKGLREDIQELKRSR